MKESTARQLDAFRDYPPKIPVIKTPDIRLDAPSVRSKTSEDAADSIKGSPFTRTSYRRILFVLAPLRPEQALSREEICSRAGIKESAACARLSELAPTWVEVLEGACRSSAGKTVNGYRLTESARVNAVAYTHNRIGER